MPNHGVMQASTDGLALCLQFYGRRPIYIYSYLCFVIWIIPSAVARNMATMLVARFFDGLAGSAFLSVAGGTVGGEAKISVVVVDGWMLTWHRSVHQSRAFG